MIGGSRDGVLLALEGIDGAGKSTQAALLRDWASGLGWEVVLSKEPTDGPWGQRIRQSMFTQRLPADEELQCFVNDRKEHVEQVLLPALERGALVVVDRYYYSTVAYQGARGLDPHRVLAQNRAFAPTPDLVFLFDLEPAVSLQRVGQRGATDTFESLEALTQVRARFLDLLKTERHVVLLDASEPPARTHERIVAELVTGVLFPKLAAAHGRYVPPDEPRYGLLKEASALAADHHLPVQDRVRHLWVAKRARLGP